MQTETFQNLPEEQIRRMEEQLERSDEELSKYSLLHDMSDMEKLRFFARIKDDHERERLNTIEMWIELAKKRFNIDDNHPLIQVFKKHVTNHLLNGVSMQGLREKAYVDALRNEHYNFRNDMSSSEIKKWISNK